MKRKAKAKAQHSFEFAIEGIDGMGQGVARDGATTCFIARTLPGETGSARVYKARKGVSFAAVESLDQVAANRVQPQCEHFGECPGCHFLHTDYDSEIQYKLAALERLLRGLPLTSQQIDIERAPERLGYRNRVQLHYRHHSIGMVDARSDRIVEIPHCKVIEQQLQPALAALYEDKKSWSDSHPGSGHCEIYFKDGELRTSWNQRYADGGFTQVNDAMNRVLRARLVDYAAKGPATTVLDLFAGQGNLSEPLMRSEGVQRVMVDQLGDQQQLAPGNFYNLDLFEASTLTSLARREAIDSFELMIVDPPRKGFAGLAQWVQKYKPRQLIYVSCNAATMVRDLNTLQGKYSISDICLIDLFPATYHFETMVRVEFSNHAKRRGNNKK